MYCPRQFTYVIQPGDTLYHLARHFRTTVSQLMELNPGIEPHNLRIGSSLLICPGADFEFLPEIPEMPELPAPPHCEMREMLVNDMRLAWIQHVYWTRLLILSIVERMGDESVTTGRLLRNPGDIAMIFANYYPPETARAIKRLLTEHLEIGAALITAMRDGDELRAQTLRRRWYMNADQMAMAFSSINPYYIQEEMREMLFRHLDLTGQEAAARIRRDYPADLEYFEDAEAEMISMADTFASGIMKQFPDKFRV